MDLIFFNQKGNYVSLIDPIENQSNNEHFQEVLDKALSNPSRRSILRGGLGLASMFALPMLPGCGDGTTTVAAASNVLPSLASSALLKFTPVLKSYADQLKVPAGYTVKILHATGDTLDSNAGDGVVAAYSNAGADAAESWAKRVGDQHDGTEIFCIATSGTLSGKSKGSYSYATGDKVVIAVNNESSAEAHFFHLTGQTSGGVSGRKFDQFGQWDLGTRPADEAIKEILMHGVTIAEVTLDASGKPTGYNSTSNLNRRITPETVMAVNSLSTTL
jgi:secreted PhoX family phosphatase